MNSTKRRDGIPFRTMTENRTRLQVYLPPRIFHLMRGLFGEMTKPQILTFIDKLLASNRTAWDTPMVEELVRIIQEENVPAVVIDKRLLNQLKRLNSQFKKWGIIYQGNLYTTYDTTITPEQSKQLKKIDQNTQVAIIKTSEQQPFPEQVKVSELQIVYFDQ